eukprot:790004-Pyramimonas_sp.AAC.5
MLYHQPSLVAPACHARLTTLQMERSPRPMKSSMALMASGVMLYFTCAHNQPCWLEQLSTVEYSGVQWSTVECSGVQWSTVEYSGLGPSGHDDVTPPVWLVTHLEQPLRLERLPQQLVLALELRRAHRVPLERGVRLGGEVGHRHAAKSRTSTSTREHIKTSQSRHLNHHISIITFQSKHEHT